MKKLKKLLIVTFAFLTLLTLTGCDKKYSKSKLTPQEALTKSQEVTKNVDNYNLGMKVELGFDASIYGIDMSMDLSVNVDSKIDMKNQRAYMSIDTSTEGKKEKQEIYIVYDKENKTVTTYTSSKDGWSKVVANSEVDNIQDYSKEITDILLNSVAIEQKDADKDNYNYELTLNKADLMKLLSYSNMNESMDNVLSNISGNLKLNLSLNKNDYSLNKLSIDLLDILNSVKVEGIKYNKCGYEITFSNYGKVGNIEVPEDVVKNAKEKTEQDFDLDDILGNE